MSNYRHRYPTKCPKCDADLTVDNAVTIHFIVANQANEVSSCLDQEGWLVDIEGVVAHGYHSGPGGRACGEVLEGH